MGRTSLITWVHFETSFINYIRKGITTDGLVTVVCVVRSGERLQMWEGGPLRRG